MQIRTVFLACMATLTVIAISAGILVSVQAIAVYRSAGSMLAELEIDRLLFEIGDKVAAERPIVRATVMAGREVDAATSAALAAARKDADGAIAHAEHVLDGLGYPGATGQADIVRTIREDLRDWRALADTMLGQAPGARDAAALGRYLNAFARMFRSLDFALDLGEMAIGVRDGMTVELLQLSRAAWSARRLLGVQAGATFTALLSGKALPPQLLEQQAATDGAIKEQWMLIGALARHLNADTGMTAKMEAMFGIFIDYDRVFRAALDTVRYDGPYTADVRELDRKVSAAAAALRTLRDTALDAATDRTAVARHAAAVRVAVSAAAGLAVTAICLAVLLVLRNRIVNPVLTLTQVIGRLSRREFDVEIPPMARGDEIGRMGAAIEALRRAGIAAERSEARIVHMARHDGLTGLANRTLLHERMEQAMMRTGRGQQCAVLCLDLDRFKAVNDTFGHPIGDRLLQAVSERLSDCVREIDTVSRLGGDEFVVLMVNMAHADEAAVLAKRIIVTLSTPFVLDGQTVSVGSSVGIAIAPQDATSAVTLLKRADTALYRAKDEQRGTYRFFEPEMDAKLQARMALERDLREALRTNGLDVAYQPQYNLAADVLCGFEALVRWNHPTRGTVGPGEFIPLAEETGLITAIGTWVLRQACKEAMNWPDSVKLAVNLSAIQFKGNDLVPTVRAALAESGLPPSRLDLEITETVLLKDNAATMAVLHELHAIGVSISMDDFGTGYSSLSYLRSFPFDKIKIDQSFVRDMAQHEDSEAIVRAVVALGNSLGITTTAEGVETAAQLAQLRAQGCTEVQGYLFSKPTTADMARRMASGEIGVDALIA
jgi:diguanylate cyclase (GGDEF)-like protein